MRAGSLYKIADGNELVLVVHKRKLVSLVTRLLSSMVSIIRNVKINVRTNTINKPK